MKRIKRVFSSSQEVFHMWAAQSQDSARQGGNPSRAFFKGTSCYSYGMHYEVGRLVTVNKHQVALINTTGYSHTTNHHINEAFRAVSHMPIVEVDGEFDWRQGLLTMQGKLVVKLFDILNGRSFYRDVLKYTLQDVQKFNTLCEQVGMLKLTLEVDDNTKAILKAHIDKCLARQKVLDASKAERQAIVKAERAVKNAAEVADWKQGGQYTNAVGMVQPQIIRIHNGQVQTSGHANVTLTEAYEALGKLKDGTLKHGDAIGAYEFDSLKGDVLTIGCHKLSLKEVVLALNSTIRLVKE